MVYSFNYMNAELRFYIDFMESRGLPVNPLRKLCLHVYYFVWVNPQNKMADIAVWLAKRCISFANNNKTPVSNRNYYMYMGDTDPYETKRQLDAVIKFAKISLDEAVDASLETHGK